MAVNCWQFTCRLGYKEMSWEFLLWAVSLFGGRFLFNSLISVTRSHLLAALCMEGKDLGHGQSQRLGCCLYLPARSIYISALPIFFQTWLWMPSKMHTLLWLIIWGSNRNGRKLFLGLLLPPNTLLPSSGTFSHSPSPLPATCCQLHSRVAVFLRANLLLEYMCTLTCTHRRFEGTATPMYQNAEVGMTQSGSNWTDMVTWDSHRLSLMRALVHFYKQSISSGIF